MTKKEIINSNRPIADYVANIYKEDPDAVNFYD